MQAGRMREPITIQAKTTSRDAYGAEVITWADQWSDWAQVQPIGGREYTALRQAQSDITMRMRIRYRTGVDAGMRVMWRERPYDVLEVINRDARDRELELLCAGDMGDA